MIHRITTNQTPPPSKLDFSQKPTSKTSTSVAKKGMQREKNYVLYKKYKIFQKNNQNRKTYP